TMFGRSEFAASAQKFLEARDTFDRAAKTARAKTVTPNVPTAAATAAATIAPTAAVTSVSTAAPTAPPTAAPIDEEPAIRRLVADYKRVFETSDIGLYRTIRPSAPKDEQK